MKSTMSKRSFYGWVSCQCGGNRPTQCSHCQPYQNADKRHLEGLETTKSASEILEQILARAAPRIDRVIDDELSKMWNEHDCGNGQSNDCTPENDSLLLRDSKL